MYIHIWTEFSLYLTRVEVRKSLRKMCSSLESSGNKFHSFNKEKSKYKRTKPVNVHWSEKHRFLLA